MELHVLTLFPEMIASFLQSSLLGKAVSRGILRVRLWNIRDWTRDKHHCTDDVPYGGGPGMVMKPEPIVACLEAVAAEAGPSRRVLLTPGGAVLDQRWVGALALEPRVVLVCGRYEGVDERVRAYIDEEISIGDYVLSGGEAGAIVVIDAVARLLPGVLGDERSLAEESFSAGLLEYPQYTRPAGFRGAEVPHTLLGGDHARIAAWRRRQALIRTRDRRPDLFARIALTPQDRRLLEEDE